MQMFKTATFRFACSLPVTVCQDQNILFKALIPVVLLSERNQAGLVLQIDGTSNTEASGAPLIYFSNVFIPKAKPASSSKRNTGITGASFVTPSS